MAAIEPEKRDSWATDVWLKLSVGESDTLQVDMNGTVYRDLALLKANLRALAEVGPESPVVLDIAPSVQMDSSLTFGIPVSQPGFNRSALQSMQRQLSRQIESVM